MWRLGGLLLACGVLLQWQMAFAGNPAALVPPSGNSLSFSAKASGAREIYECTSGRVWKYVGGDCDLVDPDTLGKVGSYVSSYDAAKKKPSGTWTLTNSASDAAESGSAYSTVTGTPMKLMSLSAKSMPAALCQATSHQFKGAAAAVSYIVRSNPKGGLAPPASLCTTEGATVDVPYSAVFEFYNQDTVPPFVPNQLNVPNGRVVDGFFARGAIKYVSTPGGWKQKAISARLYDVPGGTMVGDVSLLRKPDKFGSRLMWQLYNPNGFSLVGQACSKPVSMYKDAIPWQLVKVTSSGGNQSEVGPYTHVLMVSTEGGMEPQTKMSSETAGLVWTSSFSCIFWLFASGP